MNWPAFTNPWVLAGLAAVALPVLIHYLTRARPRRVPFPPFHLLMEACAGQQALHRLRTWILLALRCLAILALVLLFARPFLRPKTDTPHTGTVKRVVLVIDSSLSMRAVDRGVTLFSRAQSEAADVLRGLRSDEEAAVILMGAEPRPILPALSRNIPALHEALVQSTPSYERGDVAGSLALARRMLEGEGTIYVFSDFQRSNWTPAVLEELRQAKGVSCFLRPVVNEAIDNVALTAVQISPAEPVVNETAEIVCTVFNSSPRPRQETVRLELEGVAHDTRVSLPPYTSRDAVFQVSMPSAGCYPGRLALGPDALREDDVRYFALHVHKSLQIMLVSDSDARDRRSGAFFVAKALVPSEQVAPGLTVVRRHSQDTDRGILETADTFVLVPPVALSGEATEIIARRVTDGANLICVADGPTSPATIAGLGGASQGALAPPFQLLRTLSVNGGPPQSLTTPALTKTPLKLFADPDQGDLATLSFRRHYQNQVIESRRDEVLLFFADGSAALSLSPAGKGTAVFATFPFTTEGGNLTGSPLFPSLLHELLRLLRRTTNDQQVTPGHGWQIDAPALAGDAAFRVVDPDGATVETRVVSSGRTIRLSLPAARQPGHYRVKHSETVMTTGVVNVDPEESDTRSTAVTELAGSAATDRASVTVVLDDDQLLVAGKTRELWPWLAAVALTLFATEMLLLALWRRTARPLNPGGAS